MEAKTLEEIVRVLEANPTEEISFREEFLDQIGVTADEISAASGRVNRRDFNEINDSKRKMDFRDFVFWFAPKGTV